MTSENQNISNFIPKVLIIGETFRTNGGGGITLINLFKDWPSENLAVITDNIAETTADSNCSKYYQLGNLEKKTTFPFNLFKQKISSGPIQISKAVTNSNQVKKRNSLKSLLKSGYKNFMQLSGLNYFFNKISISNQLLSWISDYKPDIIYVQPFKYEVITFAKKIGVITKIPLVIHVMDDAVRIINKPNLLYFYWNYKINSNFKQLVNIAVGHFSISPSMSQAYQFRYQTKFYPFRNPIQINDWTPFIKKNWKIANEAKIVYTGRLAVPNIKSLYLFCKAIDCLNTKGSKLALDIYSIDDNITFSKKVTQLKGIKLHKAIPYNQIPALMANYDAALLPIDFTSKGINYAKYSISTKTSEYMISGLPILLFAPLKIALTDYAAANNCMMSINQSNLDFLTQEIDRFFKDESLRASLANKAICIAKSDSDATLVRNQFKELLCAYANSKS